uniref:Uncharacterized protein n=1 Tax=Rhizophora mucronata TaxID=61149 RepID=A0A2P2N5A2_RHIMU
MGMNDYFSLWHMLVLVHLFVNVCRLKYTYIEHSQMHR